MKYFPLYIVLVFHLATWESYSQKQIKYVADLTVGTKQPDGSEIQKLVGNVKFMDQSTTMYCDSAFFFDNEDIDAFGEIKIIPNDGKTTVFGNIMHYTASTHTAEINQNVMMVDDKSTLRTESLFYDLRTQIASYPTKAVMVNGTDNIVSDEGWYDKNNKIAYFRYNVVVTNPQYIIHTDSMNYSTTLKTVYFLCPTHILVNDNDSIYCESGWYNTLSGISTFCKNAWMKSKEKIIKSDTLYYEKFTGFGRAYSNTRIIDTSQNITICGNKATLFRPEQRAVVTERALLIQVDKGLDSLFLHSDTIRYGYTVDMNDSLGPDTFKFVKAYYHVRFFRSDLQGKCDSLYYSFKDSTLDFFRDPVIWSEGNQMTAEHIKMYVVNQRLDHMDMTTSSFIISQDDSIRFNQIKGRDVTGYFVNNELYKMHVKGNAQAFWFARDELKRLVGVKHTESAQIVIFFKKSEKGKTTLDNLTFINDVSGTFHPPLKLSGNDLFLKDFKWREAIRPISRDDVFIWKQ